MNSAQFAAMLKSSLPLLGVFGVIIIIWGVRMLMERSNNIKKATDHAWVEIIPKVGKSYDYLTPILEGGTVRIQDRHDNQFARFVLSDFGATKADYPPGRNNFVQVTVDKIIFREGDSIPLSVLAMDRPIFDAHQLDALIENVAVAAAEATRLSIEESKGTVRHHSPFLWTYIILGVIVVGVAALLITQHGANDVITKTVTDAFETIKNMANAQGVQIGKIIQNTPVPK